MAAKGLQTRARFIEAARTLVEAKGYHGTGLNEVLALAGAPRGSFYHHFPRGKDQLIGEALAAAGQELDDMVNALAETATSSRELVAAFLEVLAERMTEADYAKGCPIATVALEVASSNPQLQAVCGGIYSAWQERLTSALLAEGRDPVEAEDLGATVLALIEGALVLARANRSRVPIERSARQIARLLGMD
ncbi:TetR/AcrR family transcriptional regulator [Stackebrandtia nassauensis]|uniref:Transcriptional regulator, TetR family n=1 Tax=Stackebrandtia nassauensis (strain DSM 44728 / CIP 108903 / NRRL B-16338 / NBRC 102104 / LLR-40K-21) TaxID=446470 RepID=D3Q9V7_STANL|nr:TetR/AcrR family transcriptional regulator [Stackebrandtia nassauensis]ADD44653.1 transcriptional regulator, TetR family [Stackebrandtia nassauensis DSM 44728]